MNFRTNITKRHVRQKNREGKILEFDRYILHYRDPATGKRVMQRFETRAAAETAQNQLIRKADTLVRRNDRKIPTLREAVDYWLKMKKGAIQDHTHHAYTQVVYDYLIGPAFKGTEREKFLFAATKQLPQHAALVPMLNGDTRVDQITTAEIRSWFQRALSVTSTYNARLAKKHLSSIFRLVEEDFEIRLARLPSRPGPVHRRKSRVLLTEDQIPLVLEEAKRDKKWGAYYAFLFLTGARPGEMLGLLWDDVDLARGLVRICRNQQPNGILKESPKTEAGTREIPLNSLLRDILADWKERCPRYKGEPQRVFPAQGHEHGRGRKTQSNDHPLLLSNFRYRVWYPMLKRLGLPKITIYAARHMAISHLQSQGVEVGLVAKIAGHSGPRVTLQYYTHAVRQHTGIMEHLNAAYGIKEHNSIEAT